MQRELQDFERVLRLPTVAPGLATRMRTPYEALLQRVGQIHAALDVGAGRTDTMALKGA